MKQLKWKTDAKDKNGEYISSKKEREEDEGYVINPRPKDQAREQNKNCPCEKCECWACEKGYFQLPYINHEAEANKREELKK
jgi:hypothetical protein